MADINKAPRKLYSTMNTLGGMGRGATMVQKITFKSKTATTELEVANLKATYFEDSFQPQQEEAFDYSYFNKIEEEWASAQDALDSDLPSSPAHATWPFCPKEDSPTLSRTIV